MTGPGGGWGRPVPRKFKGSDTFFVILFIRSFLLWLSGSSAGVERGLQRQLTGGGLYPILLPERAAAMQAGIDGLDLFDADAVHPRRPVFRQRHGTVAQHDRLVGFGFGANGQAAPCPIAAAFDRRRPPGVAFDVPQQRQVIAVALDGKAFVTPLIDMSDADGLVGGVPAVGVRGRDPLHKRRQVAVRPRPQHQVPVVAHQAIAAQPHPEPLDPFSQHRFKRRKIRSRLENPQPTVGTVQYMVHPVAVVNSLLSWHNRPLYPPNHSCQQKKVSDPLNFLGPVADEDSQICEVDVSITGEVCTETVAAGSL